ncbi:MAG: SRPBCC domain-containing protein [Chitinophagaceae bacterium]|nr:MAG: SRPBCC domain-containing protein [Chitinophagaceae bacterium]
MRTLEFTVQINAPRTQVWEQLWSDAGYRNWTAAFSEGSYAETDWKEGSPVRFLGPDGSGMLSEIVRNQPLETMIFRHQAEIKAGEVQPRPEWAGGLEAYHLEDRDGGTFLRVSVDAMDTFCSYLEASFPKALESLRAASERPVSA